MKKLLTILIVAGFAVACNKGADPVKDYSDIKAVPKHDKVNGTQYVALSPFKIKMIGSSDDPQANFIAGSSEPGRVTFEIQPVPKIEKYHVTVVSKPEDAIWAQSGPHTYVLTWKPDRRVIPVGKRSGKALVQLKATVDTAPSEPRLVDKSSPVVDFQLNVDSDSSQPKIMGVDKLSKGSGAIVKLDVGSVTLFDLRVEDPSSSDSNPPEFQKFLCDTGVNGESPKEDGTDYVKKENVTAHGGGKFTYHLKLDLASKPVVRSKNSGGTELCFRLAVRNEQGIPSGTIQRTIEAMPKARNPIVTINNKKKVTEAGRQFDLDFFVDAGTELGTLKVVANKDSFPGDDNNRNLQCTPNVEGGKESLNQLECNFHWIVPDDQVGRKITLVVTATHTVERGNEKPERKTNKSVEIEVVPKQTVNTPVRVRPPAPGATPPKATDKPKPTAPKTNAPAPQGAAS